MKYRRLWFWTAYTVPMMALIVAGLEFMSSFVVPPWPERELRQVVVPTGTAGYNSWGLRDRERSLTRPADIDFRAVLVGDSFLEGGFVSRPVGARIEELFAAAGRRDMEAVSLGISATGPPQYYYRIKNIALSLQPDAVVLIFFSGNDFVPESLGAWLPAIAERPQPSWLGGVAPQLTWLVVNRLALSEAARGDAAGDFDKVNAILQLPRAQRVDATVRFLKQDRLRDMDEAMIRVVIGRAGDAFWDVFETRDRDQEYLQSWWLTNMVQVETATWPAPISAEELERSVDPAHIESTMT